MFGAAAMVLALPPRRKGGDTPFGSSRQWRRGPLEIPSIRFSISNGPRSVSIGGRARLARKPRADSRAHPEWTKTGASNAPRMRFREAGSGETPATNTSEGA